MWNFRKRRIFFAVHGAFFAAICVAVVGCGATGDGRDRQPISGAITVDGAPLQSGYLVFEPKSGQPTQSGGMIADGKYDVPAAHGAVPGAYSVAIFAAGAAPSTAAEPGTPGYEEAMAKNKSPQIVIPEKYNVKSELTAEVKAGETNVFDFDLMTK